MVVYGVGDNERRRVVSGVMWCDDTGDEIV